MTVGTAIFDLAARVFAGADANADGGLDRSLWSSVEAAGLDRLLLPEEKGGAGDAFADAVEVMLAFGRSGAALPMAETLTANWCLAKLACEVAPGPKCLLLEPDCTGQLTRDREEIFWRGSGVAYWAPATGTAVAVTSQREGTAGIVDMSGLPCGETVSGEPMAWIQGDRVLPATGLASAAGIAESAQALAVLLDAAAIVGALERTCELTVEHANTRNQFGQALSRFQAVQHMAAHMASETAAARAAVEHAAAAISGDNPLWAAAVAKARASEAAGQAAAHAHQIHGAIGYTREYELQRHTRRAWTWRESRGNEHYWNRRIGAAAIRAGGDGLWQGLLGGMRL